MAIANAVIDGPQSSQPERQQTGESPRRQQLRRARYAQPARSSAWPYRQANQVGANGYRYLGRQHHFLLVSLRSEGESSGTMTPYDFSVLQCTNSCSNIHISPVNNFTLVRLFPYVATSSKYHNPEQPRKLRGPPCRTWSFSCTTCFFSSQNVILQNSSLRSEVQLAPFLQHHSNWQLDLLSSNEVAQTTLVVPPQSPPNCHFSRL